MSLTLRSTPATGGITGKGFMPGVSGNPSGKPKYDVDISALCREHGPRGVEVAAELMEHGDPRVRLAAVMALWDRGFGKPVQAIASQDTAATLTFMHLIAAQAASNYINGAQVVDVVAGDTNDASAAPMPDLTEPAIE